MAQNVDMANFEAIRKEDVMRLEKRTSEIKKKEELLEQRAAEIEKREELLEQKIRAMNEREELIESKGLELKESIKIYFDQQAKMTEEVESLAARAAQVTDAQTSLEKHSSTIEQRRQADEEMIRRREDNLKHSYENLERHRQTVIQLHQTTKERLDTMKEDRAEDKLQKAEFLTYTKSARQQLKAEAAKVQGLINKLRDLKSSIATPLQNCEAALAQIKEGVRSLDPFEAEQREKIASINNELALVSANVEKHKGAMSDILKDLEAVDPVSSTPNTIIPSMQDGGSATDPPGLSVASDHVRNVWRQIEFPEGWTAADSAKLLVILSEAKERKGGKNNRYWPQQAMDAGSKYTQPYCLSNDVKRLGNQARQDGRPCESHAADTLCLDVFYSTADPGEYDSEATDKRWRLEKR